MCCGLLELKMLEYPAKYLVESKHLPGHLAAIVQGDSHAIVDLAISIDAM